MRYPRTALLLAGLALVVGCGNGDNGVGVDQRASVRLVNAVPGSGPVDVMAGSATLASGLAYGAPGKCVEVSTGAQTLSFQSGGIAMATVNGTFSADGRYTALLHGDGTVQSASLLNDSFSTPAAGNNALRFFNATGSAGDVYVTVPGGAVTGTPSSGNVAAGSATTTYSSYPNTDSQIRLFDVGALTAARSDVTLGALGTKAGTVVFVQPLAPADPTGFVVEPCS